MNTIKLNLNFPADLHKIALRLQDILGFEIGEGVDVTAVESDVSGLKFDGKTAVISYAKRNMVFRELGILCENIRAGKICDLMEDGQFETVSLMIDSSRCAVPTVDGVKRLMDYLAVMGYNQAMLYTEDTVELVDRPYFGYMRGRYTAEEIRAMDDYAYDYGIELMPCIECYAHMEKYLMWREAMEIKDTSAVMLAREEKTFEFVESLIAKVSSCYRTRRIHIGMDEAWDMGRGKFLDKHGYVPPFEIFNEYMERLIQITDKYGLRPMMWSDMYFRVSDTANRYYAKEIEISDEVASKIPENVELVYWHYGEDPYCDNHVLEKHMKLNRNVIFAGGAWSWSGHFPEHNYAMDATRFSLNACRNYNVREAMMTCWFNDNAECDLFANLFGLSYFAEMCFDKDVDEAKLRARFEACTGGSWQAFYEMSYYHNIFDENYTNYGNYIYSKHFLGKALFWQDVMEGLYDTHLFTKPMSGHYAGCAERMKGYLSGGTWDYLYDLAYKVFDYLALKTEIAEKLVPSYKAGDTDTLRDIAQNLFPLLKEKTAAVHEAHKMAWFDKLKVLGWSNLDVRYAGVAARCDTAIYLINRYLDGKDAVIEELEQERLPKTVFGSLQYSGIATVNLKI